MVTGDRGQAHTLEAIAAALLLLASLSFALQMTIVTPLSASTSSQHLESQQSATANGILASAAETGALREAVLFWNDTSGGFHGTGDLGYYTADPPDNAFGEMLNRSFDRKGIAYNVYVKSQSPTGETVTRRMVYRGVPSEHAVSATRTLTLRNDDRLVDADGTRNATSLASAASFYIRDADASKPSRSRLYNLVTVEVVVWRI